MSLALILKLMLNVQKVSEVAHLKPFLTGTMLFSSISPNFEANLKDELFCCFKYIGIPFDILDRMPVRDRKYYIAKHNGEVERENKESDGGPEISDESINTYANLAQLNKSNMK